MYVSLLISISIKRCLLALPTFWSMQVEIRDFQAFALCLCVTDISISSMRKGVGIEQYSIWAVQAHALAFNMCIGAGGFELDQDF